MRKLIGFPVLGVLGLTWISPSVGADPARPHPSEPDSEARVTQALAAAHQEVAAGARIAHEVRALANAVPRLAAASTPSTRAVPAIAGAQNGEAEGELEAVRSEMEGVLRQLAAMKARDAEHRKHLDELEARLDQAAEAADTESRKLTAATESLFSWEKRAQRAEEELERTKEAMQDTLQAAQMAKGLNGQLREKLARAAAELTERDQRLQELTASLADAESTASEFHRRIAQLEKDLESRSRQLENANAAAARVESQRDALQLRVEEIPGFQEKIAQLEKSLAEQKQAEALRDRQEKRREEASEKMQARLNEALLHREELHDELMILRHEFADFRHQVRHAQARFEQESLNRVQAALALASVTYQKEIQERNARLTQTEKSLRAKEEALQEAYGREREAAARLEEARKARQAEEERRLSLSKTLQSVRNDLETFYEKAAQLNDQLSQLELEAVNTE